MGAPDRLLVKGSESESQGPGHPLARAHRAQDPPLWTSGH